MLYFECFTQKPLSIKRRNHYRVNAEAPYPLYAETLSFPLEGYILNQYSADFFRVP